MERSELSNVLAIADGNPARTIYTDYILVVLSYFYYGPRAFPPPWMVAHQIL